MTTTYRTALPSDLPAIIDCFLHSVRRSCTDDYSPAEIAVWTETAQRHERWHKAIEKQYFLLAEVKGQLAGFGSLDNGNYIDFLYLHPDFQGKGIAGTILGKLEKKAAQAGHNMLRSDVSYTAKPFFEKHGFRIVKKNLNERKGEVLVNFSVEKTL